jgi:tyrosyl-tRNA synthetase
LFEDLRWRGLIHQMTDEEKLPDRIDAGGMVLYIGFDPTADSLHVGHLQQLCLLRRFQLAGHRPIALVGGGTGMIGDPSGKSEERNLLDADELDANRAGIRAQISGFLGLEDRPGGEKPTPGCGGAPPVRDPSVGAPPVRDPSVGALSVGALSVVAPAILADNADWLASARLLDFLRDVGKLFSVNEMVRKDSVRARLEEREQSLSFTEFSYMLLQSWDFVQLYDRFNCELQLGGSDQWGNITEGVDLIRRLRGARAYGLTSPLVTKSDGTKFGKTESGSVWLDPDRTSPYSFFQFWMRTLDGDVGSYLRRFSFLDRARIEELDRATAEHPERREAQRALALEITAMVHGPEEARRAEEAASVLFTDRVDQLDEVSLGRALEDAPTTEVSRTAVADGFDLVDALIDSKLASSRRDARQLLAQGSIYVNGRRAGEGRRLAMADALHGRWIVLRRGRANQHVLVLRPD